MSLEIPEPLELSVSSPSQSSNGEDNGQSIIQENSVSLVCIICNNSFEFPTGHSCNEDTFLTIIYASN